jgi:Ulp1 family protease
VQRLAPDRWFNDNLIDAVPGLMKVDSRTFLLSSFLYRKLEDGDFRRADRWVKLLPRDRSRWVFGVCQGENHWVAVEIDWEAMSILYYDPKAQKGSSNPSRRQETVEVSN